MQSIAFGITVHNETVGQLNWCLTHLRAAYPTAPVVVVTDGTTGYAEVCARHRAEYVEGDRLKIVAKGIQWWGRLFGLLTKYDVDYVFKLDADTQIHRPFAFFPDRRVRDVGTKRDGSGRNTGVQENDGCSHLGFWVLYGSGLHQRSILGHLRYSVGVRQ